MFSKKREKKKEGTRLRLKLLEEMSERLAEPCREVC